MARFYKSHPVKGPWTIPIAITAGVITLALYFVIFFVALRANLFGTWYRYPRFVVSTSLAIVLSSLVAGAILVRTARLHGFENFWDALEWNPGRSVVGSLIGGAALAILYEVGLRFATGSTGEFREYPLFLSVGVYIVFDVCILPAIEEIYFRGILFLALSRRLSELVAISIVTVVFSLLHTGYQLHIIPIAIALAVTRIRTRSVACCFAMHASYNLFLMLYQVFFPS